MEPFNPQAVICPDLTGNDQPGPNVFPTAAVRYCISHSILPFHPPLYISTGAPPHPLTVDRLPTPQHHTLYTTISAMSTFDEAYTSFPSLPDDPTMTSFSDPSLESLFTTLTGVQEQIAEHKNSPSGTPKQHDAIKADLVAVCKSLMELFARAEKTERFKVEFAQLEWIVSTVWRDFDDAERPCCVDNSAWIRWPGTHTAWTTLLFLVGFARSWKLVDRTLPDEHNSLTDRRAE